MDGAWLEYPSVRQVFVQAEEFLGYNLSKACYSETAPDIEPEWKMPALITHCVGIYRVIQEIYGGAPLAFAGYSQGEFTALAAAGALPFPEVLGLVRQLEALTIGRATPECMFRVIDYEAEKLERLCRMVDESGRNVSISIYISNTQNVISGLRPHTERVASMARRDGARWALDLGADTAYHSPLCDGEAMLSKPLFEGITFSEPVAPIISCRTGRMSRDADTLKKLLREQVNHPVQWGRAVTSLAENGIRAMWELGPGCTTSANTRIADSGIDCRWIGGVEDL